jgi:leucyl aminopeptidase
MDFSARAGQIEQTKADALLIGHFEGEDALTAGAAAVDKALGGQLNYLITEEKFEGKVGQTVYLHTFGKIPAKKVILVGLGKRSDAKLDTVRRAAGSAAKKARELKVASLATDLDHADPDHIEAPMAAQAVVEGIVLANYRFNKYKREDKPETALASIEFVEGDQGQVSAVQPGVDRGKVVAEATSLARDLANEPAGSLTPTGMAERAQQMASDVGLECQIIEPEQMKELGMGGLLGVAQGSVQPPRFVHLVYKPAGESRRAIAIIGKGITFDSGGVDLKTADQMSTMKDDKSGAAAVIGAMSAIAKLKPAVTVHGLAPLTENMPSGSALKPGDILKHPNGKTTEIGNTDAEGRLILADALVYGARQGVDEMIDLATLTGACIVALGKAISGVMGTDQKLIDNLIRIGEEQGERLWALPLVEEYADLLRSEVADLRNVGGRDAGAITAGLFLKEFSEDKPWAHIDIAGPAWADSELAYAPKGATGVGVRTLVAYCLSI